MTDFFEYSSIPAIVALCYIFIELLKKLLGDDGNIKNLYPLISALFGASLGVFAFFSEPSIIISDSVFESALLGCISGLSATGGNQIVKRMQRKKIEVEIDDSPAKYYITGDKHRDFNSLIIFCKTNKLRRKDVIVILGDAGFNYYGDKRDDKLKKTLCDLGVTLFCIHGNKENRVQNIPTYGIKSFCNGIVYYEPQYPNLLFARDGDVYKFNGKEFIVIGGAHSVDKIRCIENELPFWGDEMPSDEIKAQVEDTLRTRGNRIYGLLTHTCPISFLPTEMFVSTARAAKQSKMKNDKKAQNQSKKEYPLDIDRSTEEWLEVLKQKVKYTVWFCGHYHADKELENIRMMKNEIIPFCVPEESTPPPEFNVKQQLWQNCFPR